MAKKKTARSIPHRRTRESHASETAEDYVEAVFEIISELGRCRVGDLAKRFDVSHVTVSRIVKRLVNQRLLDTAPYQPITLTSSGVALAKKMQKRHTIVYEFLLALGVDEQTAQIDSEGIEHHVSQQPLQAMEKWTP